MIDNLGLKHLQDFCLFVLVLLLELLRLKFFLVLVMLLFLYMNFTVLSKCPISDEKDDMVKADSAKFQTIITEVESLH